MLRTFAVTDIGMKRQLNQDAVFTLEKPVGNLPNLFVVADGMGGHKAGDYASKCALETICETVRGSFEKNPALLLRRAIEAANQRVWKLSRADEDLAGMGTTVVAATCLGRYLQVANVGDSRLYVIDRGSWEIRQITQDHSLVAEMVRMGGIDQKTARRHPDKNIITRAVGAGESVEIDFFSVELGPEDLVLMCSDGLTNMLEDDEICGMLQGQGSLGRKAVALVEAANDRGGKDNISVILIDPFAEEKH